MQFYEIYIFKVVIFKLHTVYKKNEARKHYRKCLNNFAVDCNSNPTLNPPNQPNNQPSKYTQCARNHFSSFQINFKIKIKNNYTTKNSILYDYYLI